MKKIIMLFLLIVMPILAFAISDNEYYKPNLQSVKRDETINNLNDLKDLENWTKNQLNIVELRMKQLNPELVNRLVQESDNVKIIEYVSWMSEKLFKDFYEKYMNELQEYSQNLGRKIEIYNAGSKGIDYRLSEDGLTDCHLIPTDKTRICYKPNGWIEYDIEYTENADYKHLGVGKDVPEENRSSYYNFSLNFSKGHYMFSYTAIDQEYDKVSKYRNYVVDELLGDACKIFCRNCMLNGKLVKMHIKCDKDKLKEMPAFIGTNFVIDYSNDY